MRMYSYGCGGHAACHLDAVKTLVAEGDLDGAAGHLQFLCLGHGLEEDELQ